MGRKNYIKMPQQKLVKNQKQTSKRVPVVNRYFLVMIYGDKNIERNDEIIICNELKKISTKSENNEIVVILNSYGGNVYSGVKIFNLIKSKCNKVVMVVPQFAKSTATLMCLGADEIVMGEQSELGPLDKPMEHPHLEGITISALDVIKGMNFLQDRAKELIFKIAEELLENYPFSKKDALELSTKIALGLVNPILSKEDPRIISLSYRLLGIAEHYGIELLKNGPAKKWGVDERKRDDIIKVILDLFVWRFPDHAFAITRREAKGLLLYIVPAENYDMWNKIWVYYQRTKDIKNIKLLTEEEFRKL